MMAKSHDKVRDEMMETILCDCTNKSINKPDNAQIAKGNTRGN